jgi:hypothetical protein
MAFPRAVILNRFATDFFVLMPLGRRISALPSLKEGHLYGSRPAQARDFFTKFGDGIFGGGPS